MPRNLKRCYTSLDWDTESCRRPGYASGRCFLSTWLAKKDLRRVRWASSDPLKRCVLKPTSQREHVPLEYPIQFITIRVALCWAGTFFFAISALHPTARRFNSKLHRTDFSNALWPKPNHLSRWSGARVWRHVPLSFCKPVSGPPGRRRRDLHCRQRGSLKIIGSFTSAVAQAAKMSRAISPATMALGACDSHKFPVLSIAGPHVWFK